MDWFACGHPREGTAERVPWAGDLLREDVPTCAPDDLVGEIASRVGPTGDFVVVLGEDRVVAGRLDGAAIAKDPEARAEDVMELGPRCIRPSVPVEELLAKKSSFGVKSWIVTTSHGVFLGVLDRADAERAPDR
jgi:hypothetical protein